MPIMELRNMEGARPSSRPTRSEASNAPGGRGLFTERKAQKIPRLLSITIGNARGGLNYCSLLIYLTRKIIELMLEWKLDINSKISLH